MRSPACKLLLTLGAAAALGLLGGASGGDCDPEPETVVCDTNADCPTGQVCNLFARCVDAFVTIETEWDWYVPGEEVSFTIDPNGLALEVGADGGAPPWTVERWSNQQDRWVALRVGTSYGCRTTGCADGQPVELCVDPGPPWCMEHDAPYTDSWDGTHWVSSEQPCGDTTIVVDHRQAAPPGNYRIVYRYGLDPRPGATSPTGSCAPQSESVSAVFGVR